MSQTKIAREQGFTLIELIMAMAVFSFMFMIIMTGFMRVARTHESGLVSRATQQNARIATDQLTKLFQLSSGVTITNISKSPSYVLDRICLTQAGRVAVIETHPYDVSPTLTVQTLTVGYIPSNTCTAATVYDRLTDNSVTITQLKAASFAKSGNSIGAVSTVLSVASALAKTTEIAADGTRCVDGNNTQFCSVTTMSVSAAMRGGIQND